MTKKQNRRPKQVSRFGHYQVEPSRYELMMARRLFHYWKYMYLGDKPDEALKKANLTEQQLKKFIRAHLIRNRAVDQYTAFIRSGG